ncbi:MAG: hypothetical protein ACK4RX_13125 [Chitinophagaceae bacterium]
MANVTYLLGAGASSEALPTYQSFKDRFRIFSSLFSYERDGKANRIPDKSYKNNADFKSVSRLCIKLHNELSSHRTPDTVAKKYFHRSGKYGDDLKELKQTLILFFLYEQIIDHDIKNDLYKELYGENVIESLDKRYDSFIAALLRPVPQNFLLKGNFKVLTWNYDLQFEKAFSNYFTHNDSQILQSKIQSLPKIIDPSAKDFNFNEFGLVHLNGIACEKPVSTPAFSLPTVEKYPMGSQVVDKVLSCYHRLMTPNDPNRSSQSDLITFAWENLKPDSTIDNSVTLEIANNIAEKTDILVVIGYSFPIFNREIDEYLIDKMPLKKVYIQDKNEASIKKVIEGILKRKLKQENIETLGYLSSFHIPIEQSEEYGIDEYFSQFES